MKTLFKSLLLFLICVFLHQSSFAQGSGIRKLNKKEKRDISVLEDRFRLGVTPSALLNNYVGLQLNFGIRLNDHLQFNLEYGRLVHSTAFNNKNTSGYRFRPSIKFYVNEGIDYRLHLSLGYNIRKSSATRSNHFTSGGASIGMRNYTQERLVKGLVFMFGADHNLSDRVILDVALGFGLGNLKITDLDLPPNSIKQTSFLENDTPGNSLYPIIILNIKFQYILG